LHFNGTDAATATSDWSNSEHPITFVADAQLDTAQSVFGTASLLLDGTGDYISAADSSDWNFGSSDWTVDFRVRVSSVASNLYFVTQYVDGSNFFDLYWSSDNNLKVGRNGIYTTIGSWEPSINTWYHVAYVCTGGTSVQGFINGVSIGTNTITAIGDYASPLYIGHNGIASYLPGHIDELRVLNGKAAWTSNFTPPTQEYKNALASSSSST